MADELSRLRERLDELDQRVVQALAKRLALVKEVASHKEAATGGLRDLAREEEVLARLQDLGKKAGLDGSLITRLYREIMDHSLRLQREVFAARDNPQRRSQTVCRVAYQGTDSAYSHLAAARHFGPLGRETVYQGFDTFRAVAEAVQVGTAEYGVLPVENTTAGSINETYDLLTECALSIVGEEIQPVDHCLLACGEVDLSHLRRVFSHPQALAQCSRFLSGLTNCRAEPFTDTAMAARKVREDQEWSQAAIASEEAARRYGLHIIKRQISNHRENYTRFFIVANQPVAYPSRLQCKTSIMFVVKHEPGALASCLALLAGRGLNLTKLESRPKPGSPWEYQFYADFEGNVADENANSVLRQLTAHTNYLKTFGSYPTVTTRHSRPAVPRWVRVSPRATETDSQTTDREPASHKSPREVPYQIASRSTRDADTQIVVGNVRIGGKNPVIIAGPCSVESREQIMACAEIVRRAGADILRGGCFKPRTSPYSFQGLGLKGLDLLDEAGREFDLPIVTEVLHPSDVEPVAEKADMLQIGARNMQNFALLKEVGRVDCPVMLKRGMMSSIDEWLSAAEYILAHGNQQVILCERGIRTFETATRSTLDLTAVPVVRERTHLPIVVDPSHACGNWRWVPKMTEAALASGAQGVMVEIHPEPEKALSDGPQALKFDTFERLMRTIATAPGARAAVQLS